MYRKHSAKPGILCKCASIALELKVGKSVAFGKIWACVTSLNFGEDVSNQVGIWKNFVRNIVLLTIYLAIGNQNNIPYIRHESFNGAN